ncbi:putative dihydrolipoamide acetyltransferase/Pyruvate dehydrogenase protein X component [Septoria linicola]|nr:putative dihydrolipoamide acetyltransferase/Pyruvate dehydrogenase protein X component [Septoria linicola]
MSGVVHVARASARIASRYAPSNAARRSFHVSQRDAAAQNYTMPALSPTMTEGNIAKWNLKEGDSYTAGDVILEIETDKATMDVEAQEDGVLFKMMKEAGSKGVKVGARIAVTAEQDDDLKSLEVPAEEGAPAQKTESKKETTAPKQESKPAEPEQKQDAPVATQQAGQEGKKLGASNTRKYPLYPSVETLLHQNGLSAKDAESIQATGPGGRLLKGDVLAYLGRINKDYPAEASKRLAKLAHLDLSNIQLAKKAETKPENKAAEKQAAPELPKETEIAIPISLSQVIATQKRVRDTLDIHLPLSTFIARASELANEDLPLDKRRKPTADELFNSIIGLDQVAVSKRGAFFPQITGLSTPSLLKTKPTKKSDIIDLLAPKPKKQPVLPASVPAGISTSDNIFSVVAKDGEESRATEYLERLKLVLEKEPGRLVL